jgi:hypothetical protein
MALRLAQRLGGVSAAGRAAFPGFPVAGYGTSRQVIPGRGAAR